MQSPKRIGFTGTPSDLLPLGMGKCGFQTGTSGEMVNTLTSLAIMHPVSLTNKDWEARELLRMIAKSDPLFEQPLHAIIDTGALITGFTNKGVAKFLLAEGLYERGHARVCVDGVTRSHPSQQPWLPVRRLWPPHWRGCGFYALPWLWP